MVDYTAIVRAQKHKPAPLRIHTAQLNFGKIIPKDEPYLFVNTSWGSGGPFSKEFLAPHNAFLFEYKRSNKDYDAMVTYTKQYLAKLNEHQDIIVGHFKRYIDVTGTTDIVLSCYCTKGDFCHRHLLARFLRDRLDNCHLCGELDKEGFTYCDDANPILIDVVGSEEERARIRKEFSLAFGNHYVFDVGEVTELKERSEAMFKQRMGPVINLTDFDIDVSNKVTVCCGEKDVEQIYGLMWRERTLLAPIGDKRLEELMDKLYNSNGVGNG